MGSPRFRYVSDAQGEALTRPERAAESLSEAVPLAPLTDPSHSEGVVTQSEVVSQSLLVGDQRVELLADPVREVDRRNGNAARARKQAAKQPVVVEDEDGNVHRTKAVSLVIPEEKRCRAMTVHGRRCRVGRMRGLEVCVFHSHLALTDEGLASLASDPDTEAKPRLSPRKALKAVVALRAEDLAEAAVAGALQAEGLSQTRAVLALVDSVDPLQQEEATLTLSREGAEQATWRQLRSIFSPTG